jgi:hypothetical protein
MTRVLRAELGRWTRRRPMLLLAVGALVFAAVTTSTVFASATSTAAAAGGAPSRRSGASLADLAASGGGTEAFAVGASFVGFFVFVTFIALMATEFSGGTFRSLVLRQPRRIAVILGKLVALLVVAAGVVAVAEVGAFALSLVLAPGKGIDTGAWLSVGGLTGALGDYGTALAGVAGWAVFGSALGVVFRSAPLALGVGFAWAGPFENIVVDSWSTGYRVFPGQVLASLIRGGTAELGMGRAAATAAVYVGLAFVATLVLVSRRDVTA